MDTMTAIEMRRSIRRFRADAVPREQILSVLEAARLAPSAKNRQPWRFTVLEGNARIPVLEAMQQGLLRERHGDAKLPGSSFGLPDAFHTLLVMRSAPALILVWNREGRDPFGTIEGEERITEICNTLSIGSAVQNMLLRAQELGLGTLWIANTCFAYDELVSALRGEGQLTGAVALGIPDEEPYARPRLPLEEIAEFRE